MIDRFRQIADVTASIIGSSWAFVASLALTALWLVLGPVFDFSNTWQLTMNTFASQLTFLVAFLLQNTQNRDTTALQLKLDELIRTTKGARREMLNLEELSEEELSLLKGEFERLGRQGRT